MLIYDTEILRAIPPADGDCHPDIAYCAGWHDFAGMGLACICAYDTDEDRFRVFTPECVFGSFADLIAKHDHIIGFNNHAFDDKLLAAQGIRIPESKSRDLLQMIWRVDGLGPDYVKETHSGYGLDACAFASFGLHKTGDGAQAPINWQRGLYGRVIDYCLEDVRLTWMLLRRLRDLGYIAHPKRAGELLWVDLSWLDWSN